MPMLEDPANPNRTSGTNIVAMVGRLTALALFVAARFDLPWLEDLVKDPDAWAAVIWLLSEGFFFLRRAIGQLQKTLQSRTLR